MHQLRPASFACAACAVAFGLTLAPSGRAASPPSVRLHGEPVARVAITWQETDEGVRVPGPFAVLPGGRRVAVDVPEADGILLLEGDRIVHHFALPGDAGDFDAMEATDALLVAGRRMRGGTAFADLHVFDLQSGRAVQRVQSSNPFLEPPVVGLGRDRWRIVIEGGLVGVFEPNTAATYPLWDRTDGVIAGASQMVQSTAGLGFGGSAVWIPNPDGSVSRKVRGRSELFAAAGAGEFIGGIGDSAVVLLAGDDAADGPRTLPRELLVRVHGAHTIRELRLAAVEEGADRERRLVPGLPVRLLGSRLYWCFLGADYLEIRSAPVSGTAD